ncbi:DUF1360 domain-containing protein [Izhakiella australiensis]|uniref:DUF1360 domain-containing protein n=1 Tax=Izhakiella australiensis TaxID=1926881 RepID=A0A1S8YTE1_9GAMM|nr:hypothetical protein [Izhakiella australiensis]OON42017.1 DUF1360 domain-containing protein [Izhakiella australiensis]
MPLLTSFLPLWICLVIALMASCISITVTQTEIFRPLREWVSGKNVLIGHLFTCFYCFSHWVVFLAIVVYRPVLISSGFVIIDLFVSTFFTIGLATMFSGIILKVMRTAIAKAMEEKEAREKLGF